MERRAALKNMGLVLGYSVATPTILGVLQSCTSKVPYAEWVPTYLEKDKGFTIALMCDMILPKTDTPSATEMNIHVFIDKYVGEALTDEQLELFNLGMQTFFDQVLTDAKKEAIGKIKAEDLIPAMEHYLSKRTYTVEEEHNDKIKQYLKALKAGKEAELDEEIAKFSFATSIRDLATMAYKNTEFIGEEVLAYLSIPGSYVPCGDVNELTQGKAWSL